MAYAIAVFYTQTRERTGFSGDLFIMKKGYKMCTEFGMNMSTAINVFARAVVRERKIPFEIASPKPEVTREKAMQAFLAVREQSAQNYPDGMSLDDINEEIRKVRYGGEDTE